MNFPDFRTTEELVAYLQEIEEKISYHKSELKKFSKKESFETLKSCLDRVKLEPEIKPIMTFKWLDEKFGHGFIDGTFINLAGASFSGKTFLTLSILKQVARSEMVAFFSYEMYEKALKRKFTNTDEKIIEKIFLIQDEPYIDTIEARIKRLKSEFGIRFFAIDSRMKIRVREKMDDYVKNITISGTLSRICRELGVIIILINQISDADLKADRFNLKGGNDQVYDSDIVLYLKYHKETGLRTLYCEKDRLNDSGAKWCIPVPNLWEDNIGKYIE